MECCSVGKALSEECHMMSYTPRNSMINFDDLLESDKELLVLRCTTRDQIENVCLQHKKYFLDKFEEYQRSCCNPFKLHAANRKG